MGTAHKRLASGQAGGLRLPGGYRTSLEVDDFKGSVNMKRPRPAIGTDSVPVEQTECGIARLLNLCDDNARAQGMDRACRNEDAVAHRRLETVQQAFAVALLKRLTQGVAIDVCVQSCVNEAAGFGGQDKPGFCLSGIRRRLSRGLLVVRVNLNRERLLGIEELQQQGKPVQRMMASKQLRPSSTDQFVESRACQGTELDDALGIAMIDQFPAFGVVVAVADGLAKQGFEPATPPQGLLQDGLKTQRI